MQLPPKFYFVVPFGKLRKFPTYGDQAAQVAAVALHLGVLDNSHFRRGPRFEVSGAVDHRVVFSFWTQRNKATHFELSNKVSRPYKAPIHTQIQQHMSPEMWETCCDGEFSVNFQRKLTIFTIVKINASHDPKFMHCRSSHCRGSAQIQLCPNTQSRAATWIRLIWEGGQPDWLV